MGRGSFPGSFVVYRGNDGLSCHHDLMKVPSSIDEQISTLSECGDPSSAYRLLETAAAARDPDALFTLAMWRVDGTLIQRDLPTARQLLADALQAGHGKAAFLHAYFLANGIGGCVDWPQALRIIGKLADSDPAASRQLGLLSDMSLNQSGMPIHIANGQMLSASPHVYLFSGFLKCAEAAYVRDLAAPSLQPSMVVEPRTGQLIRNPIRRSDDAMFGVFNEDLVISAINKRIAVLSATLPEQGEPLIVLRYERGGEYRAHSDALTGTDNQRIATVILYLNSDYKGGETRFVETGLTVRGQVGDALLFRNVTSQGRPDALSRHAGLPIVDGVKWIATRWIRERKYSYPAPRPALS